MTNYENIKYEVRDKVATIALNNPATLNSFSQGLRLDLIAALQRADADDEVRLIVLTGEGQ